MDKIDWREEIENSVINRRLIREALVRWRLAVENLMSGTGSVPRDEKRAVMTVGLCLYLEGYLTTRTNASEERIEMVTDEFSIILGNLVQRQGDAACPFNRNMSEYFAETDNCEAHLNDARIDFVDRFINQHNEDGTPRV